MGFLWQIPAMHFMAKQTDGCHHACSLHPPLAFWLVWFGWSLGTSTPRYRCADKSLARPISRCILFDGENISFDASPVIYINSTNIPPIMMINRIYESKNLLSL